MAGVAPTAKHSVGWRLLLSLAGFSLGFLPLGQGQWKAASAAGVVGLLVVGAWAWGAHSSMVGMPFGAGLIAVMVGVFAISQWPRGLLAAPADDWLGCWVLVGGGCLVALVVDGMVHRAARRHRPASTAPIRGRWITAVSALAILVLAGGCGYATIVIDDYGRFRLSVRDSEVLPLPPTLRLISAAPCAGGGNSGNCVAEFVVTAADGATRATTVDRVVGHLRHLGWPLELGLGDAHYFHCRDTGGILPWTSHCLSLYLDAEPEGIRPSAHPEAVTIYIGNS